MVLLSSVTVYFSDLVRQCRIELPPSELLVSRSLQLLLRCYQNQ